MTVSQKCQYALRALFELSKRPGPAPTKVSEIAAAQAIPARFLEAILGELRRGSFVESRRGVNGGYFLAVEPDALTVGEIIRFIDGPLTPVRCLGDDKGESCALKGNCAFIGMWNRARDAVAEVYDETTFRNLLEEEQATIGRYVARYCI